MKVIKKDGTQESFDNSRILNAITASAKQVCEREEIEQKIPLVEQMSQSIFEEVKNKDFVHTKELHKKVQEQLVFGWPEVYQSYSSYRNYRKTLEKSYVKMYDEATSILYSGDKENANKDARLNSTKQSLVGGVAMKEFVKQFELSPSWVDAHDKGFIHIHDMAERFLKSQNCCLFNMGGLLDGGFTLNGSEYIEPKSIQAALAVVGDVTLSASAQQYGGQM